jgi:hypothetical protein
MLRRVGRVALALGGAAALAGGLALVGAGPALADYGNTAQYQIEISANLPGNLGGGIWLWIELSNNGSGTYSGSDCGRGAPGASSDGGTVTWSPSGGTLTIDDVTLNGLAGIPGFDNVVTVDVPAPYGHHAYDFATVFPSVASFLGVPSGAGFAQVQVAP